MHAPSVFRIVFAAVVLLLAIIPPTYGKVIYVNDDAAGANDGTSWVDAYVHLQDALADANTSAKPVEIRVAQGIYRPDRGASQTRGDRAATFQLINGVMLRGGYAGLDADRNPKDSALYTTVLSGDVDGNDVEVEEAEVLFEEPRRAENTYHVVTASGTDETAVLDGFTITGGNASRMYLHHHRGGGMYNESGQPVVMNCTCTANSAYEGGGIYNAESSLTLTACVFSQNSASLGGGGMCSENSSPTLVDCVFTANSAINSAGGAIHNRRDSSSAMNGCTFTDNVAKYGGAIYSYLRCSSVLTDCNLSANRADLRGGAMYNDEGCSATLTNCAFHGNMVTDGDGGAMFNWVNSSLRLTQCSFAENSATAILSKGGGMCNHTSKLELLGCTFTENAAESQGGAIWSAQSDMTLSDCNLVENQGCGQLSLGGGIYACCWSGLALTNCAFDRNSAGAWGGGMYSWSDTTVVLSGCAFSENSAGWGGAAAYSAECNATLTDCRFDRNVAETWGGGALYDDGSEMTVTRCTFVDNVGDAIGLPWGGGAIRSVGSSLTLDECALAGNATNRCGGAMNDSGSSFSMANCVFAGNSAESCAGSVYCDGSSGSLTNCSFTLNFAENGRVLACDSHALLESSVLELRNCIIWDGGAEIWNPDDSAIDIVYSDIQGGWPGQGNIDVDPLFGDPGRWVHVDDPNLAVEPNNPSAVWMAGDYHLRSGAGRWDPSSESWVVDDVTSPCVDAGDPNSPVGEEPSPNNGRINMGAYGGTAEASRSPSAD